MKYIPCGFSLYKIVTVISLNIHVLMCVHKHICSYAHLYEKLCICNTHKSDQIIMRENSFLRGVTLFMRMAAVSVP
jgi:hypothetical protein